MGGTLVKQARAGLSGSLDGRAGQTFRACLAVQGRKVGSRDEAVACRAPAGQHGAIGR